MEAHKPGLNTKRAPGRQTESSPDAARLRLVQYAQLTVSIWELAMATCVHWAIIGVRGVMRDDFQTQTKELLAKRVGYRCSNPGCRQPTSGPHDDPNRAISVGVAAHITAASPGGPRHDSNRSTTSVPSS